MYSRQSSFQSIHCNCYHSCLCRMRHSENCSLLRSCQNSRFYSLQSSHFLCNYPGSWTHSTGRTHHNGAIIFQQELEHVGLGQVIQTGCVIQ